MAGRIVNLMPTYILLSRNDYSSYFILLAAVALIQAIIYVATKRKHDKIKEKTHGSLEPKEMKEA